MSGGIGKAIAHRVSVLARYARASPGWSHVLPWLALGVIRARLTGGEARLARTPDGRPRELEVRIGGQAGQEVRLDLSSQAELVGFEEIFARGIYRLDKVPFKPRVVLDCGANVGFFASLCRVAYEEARVFCWEPEAANFARLKAQPLLQSRLVALSPNAVSDSDGQLSFAGGGLGGHVTHGHESSNTQVGAIHLKPFMERFRDEPALVKIDIEGHEERLIPSLAGAWPRVCALFLETHQQRGQDGALLQLLAAEGFACELLDSHQLPNERRVFNEYFALRGSLPAGRA